MEAILQFFGRTHLILLHLPIGILSLALLLEWFPKQAQRAEFQPFISTALLWGSLSATLAALAGLALSSQKFYDPQPLFWHQWLGFGTAAFSWFVYFSGGGNWRFFKSLTLAAGILATGHFGGSLTHGEGFLTEPFAPETETENALNFKVPDAQSVVYQDVVKPILQKKCVSCHNPSKSKGKLLLDSPDGIRAGGESKKPILSPGKPEESELWARASLPMADEKHMPPSGRVQLSPEELILLKWWISEGADFDRRLADMKIPAEVKSVFDEAKNSANRNPVFNKKVKNAPPEKIAELREKGFSVLQLGSANAWLSISCAGKKDLTAEKIAVLKNVREQALELDFSNSNFDDTGLKTVSNFPNLTKLNLKATKISDAGIAELANLEFLESLNLTQTQITDAGIGRLSSLKNLKKIHLWETKTSPAAWGKLQTQIAGLQIVVGNSEDTSSAKTPLLPPKIRFARTLFEDTLQVTLDFPFSNINLHYAFDEASPTTESPKFGGQPIVLDRTTKLRAFAARAGWGNSPIVDATFVKRGLKAQSAKILNPPSKKYPGPGAVGLFDGKLGKATAEPTFMGWEGEHSTFVLDFGEVIDFQKVSVHFAEENTYWVFAPKGLLAWTSLDGKNWKKCIENRYDIGKSPQPHHDDFVSEKLPAPQQTRYLKITVESLLQCPAWHPGSGKKCWIFLDEVLVE